MKRFFTLWFVLSLVWVQADTLPIVADDNAKPKNWIEGGKPRGIMIEILAEVSERTGIEFTYDFGPWNRVFTLSKNGKGAIIGFSKNAERLKTWDYSVPMYYDELVFVTTQEKQFSFNGLESLAGKRIAIKKGASYGDDFEQAVADGIFELVESENRDGQMRMMVFDRVDAVLLSPGQIALASVIAENEWLQEHEDDFVIVQPAFKRDPNYLGIPKSMNQSDLLPKINEALLAIQADGTQERILEEQVDLFLQSLKN
jgi:ABC-type amino acid transport substrate-binding protein